MSVADVVASVVAAIVLLGLLHSAYWWGRADGVDEAERRRFWTDRGEEP